MSERAYYRCVSCVVDIAFGDFHCQLCHQTFPKGTPHTCPVLSEAVAKVMPSLTVAGPRSPWPPEYYPPHMIPKE